MIRKAGAVDEHGKVVINPVKGLKSVEQGASTIVWCATSPQLNDAGGVYCEDNDIASFNEGEARHVSPSTETVGHKGVMPYAVDLIDAHRLWALSEKLLGIRTEF